MNKKILFVSHKKAQCGVYEFGKSISDILQKSNKYQFIRVECSSIDDLNKAIAENNPSAVIYNYYESVMPWVVTKIAPKVFRNNVTSIQIPQIGIIHEITQQVADTATNYKKSILFGASNKSNLLFDYYIAPDPTLLLLNPIVYKTGRLIPSFQNNFPLSTKPVIGSFGFGTPKKGFEKIVQLVQQEFDEAIIRFNIPSADFGDKNGTSARAIAANCRALITKPGIELNVSHEFLDNVSVLEFLAQNTINVFLYEDKRGRGLSSAIDIAMAVKRPIAISDAVMFRHMFDVDPSILVSKNSLKAIIQNGFAPLQKHYEQWNAENLLWEYERILNSIFLKKQNQTKIKMSALGSLHSQYNRLLSKPDKSFTWLRNSEKATEDNMLVDRTVEYQPVQIPNNTALNRILDNSARLLYAPAIKKLTEIVPITMSKKIAEANVQQAFVFDTVYRHLSNYKNPRLLCVGSYEDTASMSLIKMGYSIDEIDPMINYFLQEYFTKPNVQKKSYNIIFSTSVIEHDPNDESFIKCISDLLAPGGIAVITCDYNDGWKHGDLKPDVDARLYTQHDLKDRLLPLMSNCDLIDEPQWSCNSPDFIYLNKYRYTFATFVVRKNLYA